VVTVNPKYYEWDVDSENERLLPENLQVIRTSALPVKWTRLLGIGDIGLRSLWAHWKATKSLCQKRAFDLVFISIPPHYPALLGRMIYESFKIPYVIDYIDPWILPDYWKQTGQRPFKRTLSHLISLFAEPFALKHVSHLIGVSQGTIDSIILRYPWLRKRGTSELPYGGEPADFDYLRQNPRPNHLFSHEDGLFHISYIGRGGNDVTPQLDAIFRAVKSGFECSPRIFSRLRLHFVGTTYVAEANGCYQVLPLAEKNGIQNLVSEHPGRVSYLDALQIMLNSHALLAVGSDRPHYTASKIFPYILARKPILAVYHEESSVIPILKATQDQGAVTFNTQNPPTGKVREISKRFEKILTLPLDYQIPSCRDKFEPYTTQAMTRRLSQVFDQVVAR